MSTKLPTILIDTREQNPFVFRGYPVIRKGLKYGDYSLKGHTGLVVIERKSLADLFQTVSRKDNFARFCNELDGIKNTVKYKFILVEANPTGLMCGYKYSMANGSLLMDKLMSIGMKYDITIVFGGDRCGAERLALSILKAALVAEASANSK